MLGSVKIPQITIYVKMIVEFILENLIVSVEGNMKIEIGESLLYSWLRHIKGCQLVQMNWKISSNSWEMKNEETLQKLMETSFQFFYNKYDYQIYKGTKSLSQLLQQAEIDVLGVCFEGTLQYVYAIDVAFHEAGLNYGSNDETVMRVIKKIVRSAMCLYGYFDLKDGEIIFASPKINNAVMTAIRQCVPDMQKLLDKAGLNYKVRIIANDDFEKSIMQPVIASSALIADTSELFMRSMKMYNMFSVDRGKSNNHSQQLTKQSSLSQSSAVTNTERLGEMKIGILVRTTLTTMLNNHEISREEIKLMETLDYSKKTFDIQYPLLRKASLSNGEKVGRYWAGAVESYGEKYFICSEWYETPQNNDRPFFVKWLALHE